MKTMVEIKWRLRDIFGKKKSFEDWYKEVFGTPVSKKALMKIKEKNNELEEMKKEGLAARGKAVA